MPEIYSNSDINALNTIMANEAGMNAIDYLINYDAATVQILDGVYDAFELALAIDTALMAIFDSLIK